MFELRNYSQLFLTTYTVLFIFLLISCYKNQDSIDGTILTTDELSTTRIWKGDRLALFDEI